MDFVYNTPYCPGEAWMFFRKKRRAKVYQTVGILAKKLLFHPPYGQRLTQPWQGAFSCWLSAQAGWRPRSLLLCIRTPSKRWINSSGLGCITYLSLYVWSIFLSFLLSKREDPTVLFLSKSKVHCLSSEVGIMLIFVL